MKMHTVAKKAAPPIPCPQPTAQGPDEMNGHSSAAATTASSSTKDQELTVHLPDGSTALVSIDPSKPMMDLLITICGQLRLSPAEHSLQIFTRDSSWPVTYKANQTLSSLGPNTVKLVSRKSEKDKLKSSTRQPFEITQRLIVSLPNNQKYVIRVKPEILLSELFKLATAQKGLDPQSYKLCHPSNPDLVLDMDSPLNVYGISEICLVKVTSTKGEVTTYLPERHNSESNMLGTKQPMASISGNQSPVQGSQTKAMASVPGSQPTTGKHHTMQKSPSLPGPESSGGGFMPTTSFEKKKGFLSFLRRKKSGKFSFGGSMQNLHQMDSGGTATLSRQKLDTPMGSESQLHRNSLQTSSTQTLASPSRQTRTPATASQLQLQIPAAPPKKRPAPQPPGVLLPLTTDSGTGRLVRPPPRLPGAASQPLTARTGSVEDSVRVTRPVSGGGGGGQPPSQSEETGDAGGVQLTNGIGHSPSSSQSSGFEEMSPSPVEESRKPTFLAAGCHDRSDSTELNTNGGGGREGGLRGGGGSECMSSGVVNSGSAVHFDFGLLQKSGQTKRRAPPPPAVAVQPTASSTKPTPPSSINSDSSGSSSFQRDVATGSPGVNSLRHLSRDENLHQKNLETTNERIGKNDNLQSAFSGSHGSSTLSGTVIHAGRAGPSGNLDSELPHGANGVDDDDDEEDADALAAEAEDCFCEPDGGYDGEIVFDCADFTFVVPEVQRQNANVAAAGPSNKSKTSQHRGKSVTESLSADFCPAEKLNLKAVEVLDTSQLPGFVLESKAADVLHSTELMQDVGKSNSKQPTGDEREVVRNYDSRVNSEDSCNNGVAVINGQSFEKRDSSIYDADRRRLLLRQTNISDELSQTSDVNNLNGGNSSSESAALKRLASTEEILDCSTSTVTPVAVETRNETNVTTPTISSDKTGHQSASVGVHGSAQTSSQQTDETGWEPRTIIINKSATSPTHSRQNVHESSSVKNSLQPPTTEGNELQSQTTVARGERTVQTTSQLSSETREKLSSDSFLLDRSSCSRFYPSMPNSGDTVNADTISSVADTAEEKQTLVRNESVQVKSDIVIPTSSRNSDSKPECGRKSLYHLVKHSPPVVTDDSDGVFDSRRKTVDATESKPTLHTSEQQAVRAPVKAEKHSTNTSFTFELQRHLSRWQQQHAASPGAAPEKSAAAICNSDASPSTPTKNPSGFNSVSAADANGAKEVKDQKSFVNSSNGKNISALPVVASGSSTIATGSNTRSSVAIGSNGSAATNKGLNSTAVANKGLNKTEVVFTMEQLMNAKSTLKRTAWSEKSTSKDSQDDVFANCQNPQPPSVKEKNDSTRSATSSSSTTVSSQERVKAPTNQDGSNGRVYSSQNNIPAPPPLLPALVGNHVERKTGPSGRKAEGNRNTLANKPQREVNVRDELLNAIRNAGGKPMKSRVTED